MHARESGHHHSHEALRPGPIPPRLRPHRGSPFLPAQRGQAGAWALHAEQTGLYGFADRPDGTRPDEFELPRGEFLTARLDTRGEAVGCGGRHLLTPVVAEIKGMYVIPAAGGCGVGRHILKEIERHAAAHGVRHVLLETGALNAAALALYRSCGYEPRPPYVAGRSEVNRAMAKSLRPGTARQITAEEVS